MKIKIEKNENTRLDCFLFDYFKKTITRSHISKLINDGLIKVNNSTVKSSYKLKKDDEITVDDFNNDEKKLIPWDFKLDIKYEDDNIIVLNKPKNLICHPTKYEQNETLANALLFHCKNLSDVSGSLRPGIVHRLDKNTSGLMLAAKNNPSHINLAEQIKNKTAIRKYKAIALGNFKEKKGIIDKPLIHYLKNNVKMVVQENDGLKAITHYEVIEQFKDMALVELELKTGRTHQIRAHLSNINHPLFGDDLYGAKGYLKEEFRKIKTQGQLLQSYYLSFRHPITNEKMEFELDEKDFSKDFIKVLNILRSKKNAD